MATSRPVGTLPFTSAERMKFELLCHGLGVSDAAAFYMRAATEDRALTPADYASTSGLILRLDHEVWVNAPITEYNPNFVTDTELLLDVVDGYLVVRSPDGVVSAEFWIPPRYHDETNSMGERFDSYAFTHGDRVRISPIEGCAMACHFCNLPYDFRYRSKRLQGFVEAITRALADPVQPASHILISGGTPRKEDIPYVRSVYETVAAEFSGTPFDIMMVPIGNLMDPSRLRDLGVRELSVNIEIFDEHVARRRMRQKYDYGRNRYLDYLEAAAAEFDAGRVRSMLLVGIEPPESTLEGVEAIAARGAVPVLSPFRPDPATPMRSAQPPSVAELEQVFADAQEIVDRYGVPLGPSCGPCSHNTLTFPGRISGERVETFGEPVLA